MESGPELTAASRSAGLQACQRPPGSPKGLRYSTLQHALSASLTAARSFTVIWVSANK